MVSEEREERAAGAGPAEEVEAQRAREAGAIRKVFDEALREAIPGIEAEGAGEAGDAEAREP